jgi:hypothetical protein
LEGMETRIGGDGDENPRALLRAGREGDSIPAPIIPGPRLIRLRTAIILIAAIAPLTLVIGAGGARLAARASQTAAAATVSAPAPIPTETLGECVSDLNNLVATIAPMSGDVAAQVVAQLPPNDAAAMGSLDALVALDALPPPPDASTLAHVLARRSDSSREAVLSALPPEQQAVVKAALLDTALTYLTHRVPPACP